MERLNTQPEHAPHSGQLLFEAYRQLGPTPQELQAQRNAFTEAADAVVASYATEDQRETAQIAAGIFEWFHFGEQGGNLPYGLLNVTNDTLDPQPCTLTTRIDGRVITRHDLNVVWHAIRRSSTVPITGQITRSADISPSVRAELEATIKQSAAYKLVDAFVTPPLQNQQPLTPTRRAIRESQVAAEVIQEFGLRSHQLGKPVEHGEAFVAYKRRLFALDNETMPGKSRAINNRVDIYANLRQFFQPYLLADLTESGPTNQPPAITYEYSAEDEEYIGHNGTGEQVVVDDNETLLDLSESVDYPGEYVVTSVGQQYLQLVCNEAHGKFSDTQNSEPPLQHALNTTIDVAHDYFTANPTMEEDFFDDTMLTHRSFLYGATGPIVRLSEFEDWAFTSQRLYNAKMNFISRDQFYEQSIHPAGFITQPDFNAVQATRLIQTKPQYEPLPKSEPDQTLSISFTDSLIPPGEQVAIPGYKTVSFDPVLEEWGFTPDPNGEPYVRAEVPMPEDGRLRLAAVYDRLQLDTLADFLRQNPAAHVADLADLIKSQTEYLVPVSNSSHTITSFRSV